MADGPSPSDPRAARLRAWLEHPGSFAPAASADGRTVYLISDRPGHPAAFSVPVGGGRPARFVPGPRRIGRVQPAPEGTHVVVATDADGDERWELSLWGADGRPRRRITENPERIHEPGAWRDGQRYVFGSNERDPRFFDLYEVDREVSDPPRRIREEDALVRVVAARGERLVLLRSPTNLDHDLLLRVGGTETVLNPHDGEESVFDADLGADAVYAASNLGRELAALYRFAGPATTPELLRAFDGELEQLSADRAGRRLALVENDRGYGRLYVYEIASGALRPVPLPGAGVVGGTAWLPSGDELLVALSAPELGARIYAADAVTGAVRPLLADEPPMPATPVRPELGGFRAEDGLAVPYWELRPRERPARGTIVLVHGGPESQARPGFQPVVQFLVQEGFRVVLPNVRGSLGYGRTYVHLDDVRRRMDSVRDLRDLVRHLKGTPSGPSAAPESFGVIGGSYGGFMVLSALTTYPELFDAGVDIVGISNFVTFLERTGPWRRPVREAEYGSLARDREFLLSISPLFRADRIRAPLFVVHGANDPRVPLFEAEQIVEALRRRGVAVEFLRFDDEGHGMARRENQLAAYARAAAFFDRYLAGPR